MVAEAACGANAAPDIAPPTRNQTFFLYGPLKLDGSEVQAFTNIPKMAFFVHVSCLSFKIWEAPRHLLDVRRLGDGKIIVPPLAKLT